MQQQQCAFQQSFAGLIKTFLISSSPFIFIFLTVLVYYEVYYLGRTKYKVTLDVKNSPNCTNVRLTFNSCLGRDLVPTGGETSQVLLHLYNTLEVQQAKHVKHSWCRSTREAQNKGTSVFCWSTKLLCGVPLGWITRCCEWVCDRPSQYIWWTTACHPAPAPSPPFSTTPANRAIDN